MMLALGMAAGCHTPEEKALATERVELLGMQASLATKFPECRTLDSALRELKKTTGARIERSNTEWNVLSKSKRDSLMKPHSSETGPIQCHDRSAHPLRNGLPREVTTAQAAERAPRRRLRPPA
jgi:hypothetical protein